MTGLTSNSGPNKIEWTEAQKKSNETLKKALTSYPILHLPMWMKQFYLRTDASDQGGRSERRTHGGNKCKHTRSRDVTRDNLAKNSL